MFRIPLIHHFWSWLSTLEKTSFVFVSFENHNFSFKRKEMHRKRERERSFYTKEGTSNPLIFFSFLFPSLIHANELFPSLNISCQEVWQLREENWNKELSWSRIQVASAPSRLVFQVIWRHKEGRRRAKKKEKRSGRIETILISGRWKPSSLELILDASSRNRVPEIVFPKSRSRNRAFSKSVHRAR